MSSRLRMGMGMNRLRASPSCRACLPFEFRPSFRTIPSVVPTKRNLSARCMKRITSRQVQSRSQYQSQGLTLGSAPPYHHSKSWAKVKTGKRKGILELGRENAMWIHGQQDEINRLAPFSIGASDFGACRSYKTTAGSGSGISEAERRRMSFRTRNIISRNAYPMAGILRKNNNIMFVQSNVDSDINSIQKRWHGDENVDPNAPTVKFTFINKEEKEVPASGKVGQNVLRVAQQNGVELEGACECSLACSTCHVILEPEIYDSLEEPVEEEEDMLDLAFGLTETSRLGCQVHLSEDMEGMKVKLPKATRNFYVDGHVPQPH